KPCVSLRRFETRAREKRLRCVLRRRPAPPSCDNDGSIRSMRTTPHGGMTDHSDPFPEDEIDTFHSPEPWTRDGRYIRDARGAIVVRGRPAADARRIAAAINATRDIPTEALENWLVQDVSDPGTRPDLEVALEEPEASPFAVPPPDGPATAPPPLPEPS